MLRGRRFAGVAVGVVLAAVWPAPLAAHTPAPGFGASHPQAVPRVTFSAPAADVLIGDALAMHGWKGKIAAPNEYGQYEVLLRKGAAPFAAPACKRGWLILRMPAALEGDGGKDTAGALKAGLAARRAAYDATLVAVRAGQRVQFDVTPDSYYRRTPAGGIELTGCNLFLIVPGRG